MPYGLRPRSKRVKYDNFDRDKEYDNDIEPGEEKSGSESNDSSSEVDLSEDDSSESNEDKPSGVKRITNKEIKEKMERIQTENLSDYEKIREHNIKEKMDLLNSLNTPIKTRSSPVKRKYVKKHWSPSTPSTASVSVLRLSPSEPCVRLPKLPNIEKSPVLEKLPVLNKSPVLKESPILKESPATTVKPATSFVNNSSKTEEASEKSRYPAGPLDMFEIYEGSKDGCENVIDTLQRACEKQYGESSSFMEVMTDGLSDKFKKMTLKPEHIVQIVKDRLFSIAIHPCPTMKIVSGGGKLGDISVWNVSTNELHSFAPHVRPVSCMEYNQWFPAHLISCSYDGTVRCTDLNKKVFQELYRMPQDNYRSWISYFDFASSSSLMLALGTGKIAVVDTRTDRQKMEEFVVQEKALKTICVHPVKKQYFVVTSNDKFASIYDVRKLKHKHPEVIATLQHEKSVNSAFLSPCTGNYILTTSVDNFLRIFDSVSMSEELPLIKKLRHDNQVSHWLTSFKSMWLPEREDSFAVGSMTFPRQIPIYSSPQGELLHAFTSEHMASVCSINAFHPNLSFFASGSSNGQMSIFM